MSKTLTCSICRRRQVVGLLSMQSWATAESSSSVLACPDCQADHADWRDQLERLADEPA